jgi:hypothetical protein
MTFTNAADCGLKQLATIAWLANIKLSVDGMSHCPTTVLLQPTLACCCACLLTRWYSFA